MSLFYSIAYRLGLAPWEHAADHPPAAAQVRALLDREEDERRAPLGAALDLGCGRGHWSIELASRGWRVTGIDIVASALAAAQRRARDAGLEVRFLEGDVTALGDAGVGTGFAFFWDFGTLHGLAPRVLAAAGRGITAAAAPDATLLMLAWAPGRRGPLPRGAGRDEIAAAFPAWRLIDEAPFDATGLPPPLRSVRPRVYRLRHAPPG